MSLVTDGDVQELPWAPLTDSTYQPQTSLTAHPPVTLPKTCLKHIEFEDTILVFMLQSSTLECHPYEAISYPSAKRLLDITC